MTWSRSSAARNTAGMEHRTWGYLNFPSAELFWGRTASWQLASRHRRPYQITCPGVAAVASAGSGKPSEESEPGSSSGLSDDPRVKRMRLEAVLLLSKAPLHPRKLAQLAHLADGTEARTLVRDLNQTYDMLGRALRVELVAGGYRMLTRPSLAPWLARLGYLPPVVRLSSPMMETLAVVAYRQPVSRADIEAVRGVACGELLRQLMERDLIRIAGRSEELGRPYLYGTTKRFLQLFGLPSVSALPTINWHGLQEDSIAEDFTNDDSSTSTKEPVVSTAVAPVMFETDLETHPLVVAAGNQGDQTDQHDSSTAIERTTIAPDDELFLVPQDLQAVIEDEEDDLYGDSGEDEEVDEDDDLEDDDWDDDDEDDDEEDEVEDEIEDEVEDDWEEVEDEDLDEEEEDEVEEEEDDDWDDEDDDDWDEDEEEDADEEEEWE